MREGPFDVRSSLAMAIGEGQVWAIAKAGRWFGDAQGGG